VHHMARFFTLATRDCSNWPRQQRTEVSQTALSDELALIIGCSWDRFRVDKHPNAAPFKLNGKAVWRIYGPFIERRNPNMPRPINPCSDGLATGTRESQLSAKRNNPTEPRGCAIVDAAINAGQIRRY
jgi:hypothetical protein